jgi:hypothetical protein
MNDYLTMNRGTNLAPSKESINHETIPKSATRVLNALQIRDTYKKKRKLEEEGSDNKIEKRRKTELRIKPGEPIQHFYKQVPFLIGRAQHAHYSLVDCRRVEIDMRPVVRSAVRSSKAVERKAQSKEKAEESREYSPSLHVEPQRKDPKKDKDIERHKDFERFSTSAPRRLNDVAQAPPEIKKAPRGASRPGLGGKREGVLSMAQKSMMEQEREKVINRYRMLKASRLTSSGG